LATWFGEVETAFSSHRYAGAKSSGGIRRPRTTPPDRPVVRPARFREHAMATCPRVGRDPASQPLSDTATDLIGREKTFGARNYDPLPVVLERGEGSWLIDIDGHRYLDLMSAYSAVSFGHAHPRIVGALATQA